MTQCGDTRNDFSMSQAMPAPGPQTPFDLDANDESLPLLRDWFERHGDIHRVATLSRAHDALVLHDPDAIRAVLLTRRDNYVKGVGLERVRMLLGNGLIVSDGEVWARQRRLVQPAFHSAVIRGFAPMVESRNAALVERWAAKAARGETIDVTHELSTVSLDIVLRALFGSDLDRLVASEGHNPFDLLADESRRDLVFAARFRALTRCVRAIIDSRRQAADDAGDRSERDFLSMLMAARDKHNGAAPMSDRALLDEVMTLIVAGHETTASTLNWTWYLLASHPEVQEQVHTTLGDAAAASPATDDAGLGSGFIDQVLQEALRLYPPVWLFTRRALQDDTIGGFHVGAGTDVFICPYLLHRHPAHWHRPEAFEPDRFAAAAVAARHRFAYLPFSAGPRFCIGSGFAMAEMATHVRQVTRRFRLAYVGPVPAAAEFQINLRSRDHLQMRLTPR